jgi:hypothetical protein
MKRIGCKITLNSATLLAAGPTTGNLRETLAFIPGNTVRGVLARRYLDLHDGCANAQFHKLFLAEKVRYGFATLEGSQPIPASARSCKYHDGFVRDGGHGVADLLLAAQGQTLSCPGCGQPVDYFRGYWDAAAYRQCVPNTRLATRTAIDARLGKAKTRHLYTQKVLEEDQAFYATLETDDEDLAARLKDLLKAPFSTRIGTGGSRGQGWATVESAARPAANCPDTRQRFRYCQKKAGKPVLAVTLLSDALFSDDYLRDTTRFPLESLSKYGIDPKQWQTAPPDAKAYVETRLVHGFDGEPVYLPRVPRLAVAAGSVYLFQAKAEATDALAIPNNNDGLVWIGERNDEGYGLAVLWHPFHYQPDLKTTDAAPSVPAGRPAASWLLNAQAVFQQGEYQRITPAQMSAVDKRIAQASTLADAKADVATFLKRQLDKLEKKQERGHPPSSWLLPLPTGQTLGRHLLDWIEQEQYRSPADAQEDGLFLLRRAWGAFYGQYRHHLERGKPLSLHANPFATEE